MAATSTTATAPPACSACWRPGSPCCSASSSSWPSPATTRPAPAPRRRRSRWPSRSRRRSSSRRRCRGELTGELVCYARSVAGVQWERMESGTLGEQVNPWGVELFRTLRTVEPQTATEQSAYDKWLEQTSAREEARSDRIHGAVGVIPAPLWLVLFFSAGLIFVFMLFFADSGERAVVQATAHRHGGRGDHGDAVAAQLPQQPVPRGHRRASPGGHGASAGDHRSGAAIAGQDAPPPCDARGNPL